MLIKIISVGKAKSEYSDDIEKYQKRLSHQKIEWQYIPSSSYDADKARSVESAEITSKIRPNDIVWLLDERGVQIDSPALASKLDVLKNQAVQTLVIVIGGAYGVDDKLRERANWQWSLSKMVFPHQLVRLILIEQIYRANEIARGSGYHHA